MSSYNNGEKNIFIKTPLIYSKPCSDVISRDVYLKLENTQPSGSFKLRGLSHLCQQVWLINFENLLIILAST